MKSRLMAALALLGAAALARADYVVIIANLNAPTNERTTSTAGGMGMPGMGMPGPGGGRGGMPGMPSMPGPGSGGMGMPGRPGMPSMPGPGSGGGMGMPGRPGMPGMPGPGSGGFRGGMGMPGDGGGPGGMGGYGGMATGVDAIDDAPYYVVAVIETNPQSKDKFNLFKRGTAMPFAHSTWGTALLHPQTYFYEAIPLESGTGPMPSIRLTFERKFEKEMKGKLNLDEALKLANWALGHGLVDEFVKTMDRLVELAKTDNDKSALATPAVVAFLKAKEDLAKPPSNEDVAGAWKDRLIDGYKITQTKDHHFALLHNYPTDTLDDTLKRQLDRLERTYKGFYYWWTTKGINLPVPAKRQVAILADNTGDFRKLKKHLTATKEMADSFFARREGLSVFSKERGDDGFVTLKKVSKPEWDNGYVPHLLLKSLKFPVQGAKKGTSPDAAHKPRTYALLMKALENEWEATGMSHEASRQLLYASDLLPRNVHAPEWLLFGVGSFFETPLQAPFGGPGSANSYYLPRFKEYMKANKYGENNYEALVKVVTDAGFRAKAPQGEPAERSLRQARAAAWSLYYFLAQKELPKLQRYFKELGKMPRDVELDEKALLQTFARSFDCVNPDKSVSTAALTALATRWVTFVNSETPEFEAVHKKIRDHYEKITKAQQQGQTGTGAGPGAPGRPGGGGLGGGDGIQ